MFILSYQIYKNVVICRVPQGPGPLPQSLPHINILPYVLRLSNISSTMHFEA